ncbi:hypothetical protein N7509_005037 [Penicillium cosmopolitanum]|uniref:Uncharacterized protein n=1 Tax=Penicillium cosmopolitanum TaxID=1131564 RepID=A0A9W9W1G9_9EURO|nr:uncharacterized protein N7509_005037 [Penicillium cosmopolitanum]KAJ5396924.1 hypothetical protein N7509_005037 [Penicillium cosmopolitanum]
MSESYTSSTYYYNSTTSNSGDKTTSGHRYSTSSHTDPDGTTIVRTAHQDLGQPAVIEERRYDRTGQEELALPGPEGTSAGGVRRITDLDEEDTAGSAAIDTGNAYGATTLGISIDDDVDRGSFATKVYDPSSGAYDEHSDFDVDGGSRHHREMRDSGGRVFHRDFDVDRSGLSSFARERKVFEDPLSGTRVQREEDVDVSDII